MPRENARRIMMVLAYTIKREKKTRAIYIYIYIRFIRLYTLLYYVLYTVIYNIYICIFVLCRCPAVNGHLKAFKVYTNPLSLHVGHVILVQSVCSCFIFYCYYLISRLKLDRTKTSCTRVRLDGQRFSKTFISNVKSC